MPEIKIYYNHEKSYLQKRVNRVYMPCTGRTGLPKSGAGAVNPAHDHSREVQLCHCKTDACCVCPASPLYGAEVCVRQEWGLEDADIQMNPIGNKSKPGQEVSLDMLFILNKYKIVNTVFTSCG